MCFLMWDGSFSINREGKKENNSWLRILSYIEFFNFLLWVYF